MDSSLSAKNKGMDFKEIAYYGTAALSVFGVYVLYSNHGTGAGYFQLDNAATGAKFAASKQKNMLKYAAFCGPVAAYLAYENFGKDKKSKNMNFAHGIVFAAGLAMSFVLVKLFQLPGGLASWKDAAM